MATNVSLQVHRHFVAEGYHKGWGTDLVPSLSVPSLGVCTSHSTEDEIKERPNHFSERLLSVAR